MGAVPKKRKETDQEQNGKTELEIIRQIDTLKGDWNEETNLSRNNTIEELFKP